MNNYITAETYETWLENIEYICNSINDPEDAAQEIMNYLENEAAFSRD